MIASAKDELQFLPLGGAGEVGMNLNLYGYGPVGNEKWLMIDLGVTFNNGALPGIDVLMPNINFIERRKDRLLAIVLTHAHEDHIGAVQYLWPKLRCPIYATPFTISVLNRKLASTNFANEVEINEVPLGARFLVGPYDLEFINMNHSIPEPSAIAIRTPLGTVLHTGDWKFDPNPIVGKPADEEALRCIGEEGTLALVCDSTNVFTSGQSASEASIFNNLKKIIASSKGQVAVACFATNVARLQTIARAAVCNDRNVVLAGRSLKRITDAANENGYLLDCPEFLSEEDAGYLPDDKTLIICTGSQGEPRAALARIAENNHPRIELNPGDTLIFSSRIIPGNEHAINELQAKFVRRGVHVITSKNAMIHVSGHPARDEMTRMYHYIKPQLSIPVHGELKHLREHAELARSCQVPHVIVNENGGIVRIAPGTPEIIDQFQVGRLATDGNSLIPIDSEIIKSRTRVMWHGFAVVTVILNRGNVDTEMPISTVGLIEEDNDPILEQIRFAVKEAINILNPGAKEIENHAISEAARIAARRTFHSLFGKRPPVRVHLVRRE